MYAKIDKLVQTRIICFQEITAYFSMKLANNENKIDEENSKSLDNICFIFWL